MPLQILTLTHVSRLVYLYETFISRHVKLVLILQTYRTPFLFLLANSKVSWIRKRDLHILTVGILTYSSDQRFQAIHQEGSDEWTLKITSPQPRDSGNYLILYSSLYFKLIDFCFKKVHTNVKYQWSRKSVKHFDWWSSVSTTWISIRFYPKNPNIAFNTDFSKE